MPYNQNISIILVHPQMGENIGASARAMKNFDISDLRIVKPRDGWPNQKAKDMSVGAIDLIDNAKIYESISDAISDLEYVYATTASKRDMHKDSVLSRELLQSFPHASNIGIMFGRENSGLTNEEISFANKILTIDTNPDFTSLNIAHSVALICYEIFHSGIKQERGAASTHNNDCKLATNSELEYFYSHLFDSLDNKNFFREEKKKDHMSRKIRNLFSRIDNLTHNEVQTLRGIINALSCK